MTAPDVSVAPQQDPTFYTVTYLEVLPTATTEGATWLRRYRDASRMDSGALRFDVVQRLDRPNHFVALAAWTDQAAFDAHTGTPYFQELAEKLAPTLAAPNDTRQHQSLTVGNTKSGGSAALTVVTHVDVTPPHKDNAMPALMRLAEDSRKHAGNLRFDVWQQTNRLNHFSVVETWSTRAAFDAHGMDPQTRDFRSQLAIMTGALYDERLYADLV